MTPTVIADYMASLFTNWPAEVRLLDPGGGVGSLTEAFVERYLTLAKAGSGLNISVYEIDKILLPYLEQHLADIESKAKEHGYEESHSIEERDFISDAVFKAELGSPEYTHVILNPPYKKINSGSAHRHLLRKLGIETVNLYTAFLALSIALTVRGGEVVAIIPRSFCNGVYFKPFRKWLLERVAIKSLHVFESRSKAFKEDEVLQENIIIYLECGGKQGNVTISSSHDTSMSDYASREVPFSEVVMIDDLEQFLHIPVNSAERRNVLFTHTLNELGLKVSTGPVVDFRAKEYSLQEPSGECAPLLYSHHFKDGTLTWPRQHKKPNALVLNEVTRKSMFPRGWYVFTKRFSAKEENRRLVAYVLDPSFLNYEFYGVENHLNVFHIDKHGLDAKIAYGLATFLNSRYADDAFRSFSGHTQVNATDLRTMRYPSYEILAKIGEWARQQQAANPDQIDAHLKEQYGN